MEAIAFVLGFVVLGVLALRFGRDSREGITTKEHEFAAHGGSWDELAKDRRTAAPARPSPSPTYPTLAFVERALGAAAGALTASPDAEQLEARARALTAEYWSDLVWTAGVVPEAALRQVLAELAPGLVGAPLLVVERPDAIGEPVISARSASELDRSRRTGERAGGLDLAGAIAPA